MPRLNVGEEICGEWLRYVKGCDFVQYNLITSNPQGELDVVGVNTDDRQVYACEVAVHLVTGLRYTKSGRSDNVSRITSKFERSIAYVRDRFSDYEHSFMFWSPVVRAAKAGSKTNQIEEVDFIVKRVLENFGIQVTPMINHRFMMALDELRKVAKRETKEFDSSVMRYLQIEEHLEVHLEKSVALGQPTADNLASR